MTYEELKADIADTLNRQDLTSVIPSFITMAEASLNRDLKHFKQEKRATSTFNDRFHTLPTDWLGTNRIVLDTNDVLRLISIDDMQTMRFNYPQSGKPRYYAHVAGELELYPTPDVDYTGTLYYTAKLPAIATTENFVAVDYPDLYLYGSLVHSAPYLKDDERLGIWMGLYQSALLAANKQSNESKYSGTGLKMKLRG